MLIFEPSEFELELKNALEGFAKKYDIGFPCIEGDFIDPTDEDFDPSDYDDMIITPQSKCMISLPRVINNYELSYQQFIDILLEAQQAKLVDNTEVWSSKRYLLRVDAKYNETMSLLDRHFYYQEREGLYKIFEHVEIIDGYECTCCLVRGLTIFGIIIASEGDWDKYFPPITETECFIEVSFPEGKSESMVRNIAEAYIFELSTSYNLHLTKSPRPTLDGHDYWDKDGDENEIPPEPLSLRPLLIGKGIHGVIELFNRAKSIDNPDIALLFYVKVIEYVSPTIIRQNLMTTVQNKLASPRVMNPDASFILELDCIFQENRIYKKDKESIALTIEQCCDIDELKRIAPPFLKKLAMIKDDSIKSEKEAATREFANALYATRNSIAHAKANYEPTGEECPESQMPQFVECAELAAQQVVRWFGRSPEHIRVL